MISISHERPTLKDLQDVAALRAGDSVAMHLGGRLETSQVELMLERWLNCWESSDVGPWIFREDKSGRFVGYAGLLPTDSPDEQEYELLYAVRSDRWGVGLCSQMATRAVQDAKNRMPLIRVVAWCLETNRASGRVLEKNGFDLRRVEPKAGEPHLFWTLEK